MADDSIAHRDQLLQLFTRWTHDGYQGRVTLCLAGQIITGRLVDPVTYLNAFRQQLVDAKVDEDFISAIDEKMKIEKTYGGPSDDPGYLHLLDATVTQGGLHRTPARPWRCRISDVAGFSLGTLLPDHVDRVDK